MGNYDHERVRPTANANEYALLMTSQQQLIRALDQPQRWVTLSAIGKKWQRALTFTYSDARFQPIEMVLAFIVREAFPSINFERTFRKGHSNKKLWQYKHRRQLVHDSILRVKWQGRVLTVTQNASFKWFFRRANIKYCYENFRIVGGICIDFSYERT